MIQRALAVCAILALFLIANRAAFEGYFSDDDLDNLSWATVAGIDSFANELLTPVFSKTNTRPTGGLYYRWFGQRFGFQFERYLPLLFALHLANAALLFWLARRKGISEFSALAAALFFLFHSALLEAWWKPMYIFDLLACTFCILTWLLFGTRYWLLALPTFWLAYKSKEVALFFPVVLAFDHWRRAIPFFLISASFGLQALRVNSGRDTVYTLRFSPQSLLTTIPFYGKHAVLNKFGALLLAPLAYFAANRSFLPALFGTLALMIPLLFLPGRLFSVYLYVPFIPLTIGLAAVFEKLPRRYLTAGLAAFLILSYGVLREKRKVELALGQEARSYTEQLLAANAMKPLPNIAFYENAPAAFRLHGMTGALRLITKDPNARVLNPELEANRLLARDRELPTLSWFSPKQQLSIPSHRYGEAKLSTLDFAIPASGWQLLNGWFDREGHFRWAGPSARLALLATPDHTQLHVRFNLNPSRQLRVNLLLNGEPVGQSDFTTAGTPTVDYPLPHRFEGRTELEIRSTPPLVPPGDDRQLGVAILGVSLIR
jgi:hypothetical protein